MKMTAEEIISFQGHEFTYVFSSGDTMPAYIKKIDLDKKIMSYWSFSLITDNGHEFEPLDAEEEIEAACCLGFEDDLDGIIRTLTEIKTTRKCRFTRTGPGSFEGCPF